MSKKWTTTLDFINNGKIGSAIPNETIVETEGFTTRGDSSGAKWQLTTVTGTPSQTPAQLGGALLNDPLGRQWKLLGLDVTPEMLGTGVDDTSIIKAVLSIENARVTINGTHSVAESVAIADGVKVSGNGKLVAIGSPPATTETHYGMLLATAKKDINISDIEIDMSAWTVLPSGAGSIRCITFRRCTGYSVSNVKFKTTGGAVASIGCKNFSVKDNDITTVAPEDLADGVIDTWCEFDIDSEDFSITHNVINSLGASKWGILVNGVAFESQIMKCSNFEIAHNHLKNVGLDGIWVGGRLPTAHDFKVFGNFIDTARKGISLSDCKDAHVFSNNIKNTVSTGIELWNEDATGGVTSAINCHVYDNELLNVASQVGQPTAIWVTDESTGNVIHDNKVTGVTHHYGLLFGPNAGANIAHNNTIEKGRDSRKIRQFGLLNRLDDGEYTPTLATVLNLSSATANTTQYSVSSERCMVNFKVNVTSVAVGPFSLTLSLPIGSNFVSTIDAIGSASVGGGGGGGSATVEADTVSHLIKINGSASAAGSFAISGSASYLIK